MRCFGIKSNFKRCGNKQKYPFCRHHRHQLVGFIIVAFLIPIIVNISSSLIYDSISAAAQGEPEIVCDRDKDSGCYLDFGDSFVYREVTYVHWPEGKVDTILESYYEVYILAGEKKMQCYIPFDLEKHNTYWVAGVTALPEIPKSGISFPNFLHPNIAGPFRIKGDSSTLLFFGQIKDYKNGELLGWFDENEFGVVESCSFSWNKDAYGVEIIDRYGNVCFSIDLQPESNSIRFRGYYKEEDTFYIFNEKQHITTDQEEAERLISSIEPIFDHYGKDSNGKRMFRNHHEGSPHTATNFPY